ncbi:MAG: translational GTPase TypA [Lentisphaerales bacterium]|jgi:GTP-binding protein|nr:MAG: translational GTPase TypA [Lentisphaerales bacterium]
MTLHEPGKIRNVAIVAHVDHGKTTLVDELFKQSGMFRKNQAVAERLMDSMDLERERGITISSKNGSFVYRDYLINIIDTPGHADFGGQVERVLKMADGALLLVDAQDGPMPQTYFVLKKALALNLPVVVVLNKIDRPNARPEWAVDEVFDLFVRLDAPHEILDFHTIYASATGGYASDDPRVRGTDMSMLLDAIVKYIPSPSGSADGPLQLQVSSIDYSPFLGRLGIGKITSGTLKTGTSVVVANTHGKSVPSRITKMYRFNCNQKVETEHAGLGEIVAVAGMGDVSVGDTYTDVNNPQPLESAEVDPPTIFMNFLPNTSPFSGTEGRYVTSTHLAERLRREALSDVALHVDELGDATGYKVSGRGELHLSILIEKMRREGYEFQVACPKVIYRLENDKRLEPYEELTIDIPDEYMGTVMEKVGLRKGQMLEMKQENKATRLKYRIPTRGLLGFKSEFMSDTKGMGVLSYIFSDYGPYAGDMRNRKNGVLMAIEACTTVAYALFNLQRRGRLFLKPGIKVYKGQIVGEHCRDNDLAVNPAKGKQLTNMRASGSDENVILTPPTEMSLEDCITYINDDELVEVTPKSIRLRKAQHVRIK